MTVRLPCTGGVAKCQCGWTASCRGAEVFHVCRQPPPPGLGDIVASGLSAVGITPERVQAVASAVGVKDCGCAKRKSMLNRAGQKLGLPPGSG